MARSMLNLARDYLKEKLIQRGVGEKMTVTALRPHGRTAGLHLKIRCAACKTVRGGDHFDQGPGGVFSNEDSFQGASYDEMWREVIDRLLRDFPHTGEKCANKHIIGGVVEQ